MKLYKLALVAIVALTLVGRAAYADELSAEQPTTEQGSDATPDATPADGGSGE